MGINKITVYWNVTPCSLLDTVISKEHDAFVFTIVIVNTVKPLNPKGVKNVCYLACILLNTYNIVCCLHQSYLVTASNSGRSSSSGFPKYPRASATSF
jgi:hypothetical protein